MEGRGETEMGMLSFFSNHTKLYMNITLTRRITDLKYCRCQCCLFAHFKSKCLIVAYQVSLDWLKNYATGMKKMP